MTTANFKHPATEIAADNTMPPETDREENPHQVEKISQFAEITSKVNVIKETIAIFGIRQCVLPTKQAIALLGTTVYSFILRGEETQTLKQKEKQKPKAN